MWRNQSAQGMRVGPMNASRWIHQWSFHNKGVVWDTPTATWAGKDEDWVREMTLHPPKKDEVITAFLKVTRRPTKHLQKKITCIPNKNLWNWTLWFSTLQEKAKVSSKKTGATARRWWTGSMVWPGKDWRGGAVGNVQRQLREWSAGPSI